MSRRLLIVPLVLALSALAACDDGHPVTVKLSLDSPSDDGHYKPGDGKIDVDEGSVRIVAGGTDAVARIGGDGSLRTGEQTVETSESATAALREYYSDAVAIEDHGVAIGIAGAKFGVATVKDIFHGLFTGTAEEAGRRADEGAQALVAKVQALCGRMDSLFKAQQIAAREAPAFKPYAVVSERQVKECFSEDGDHGSAQDSQRAAEPPAARNAS